MRDEKQHIWIDMPNGTEHPVVLEKRPLGRTFTSALQTVHHITMLRVAVIVCRGLVVVGAPDTLAADERWRQWMVWVRDRGGLLAPEALRPTPEEIQSGFFDPLLDEYFELAPKQLEQNDWFSEDMTSNAGDGWYSDPSYADSKWPSKVDPDAADEKIMAAWEREKW